MARHPNTLEFHQDNSLLPWGKKLLADFNLQGVRGKPWFCSAVAIRKNRRQRNESANCTIKLFLRQDANVELSAAFLGDREP